VTTDVPHTGLQLRSLVKANGTLELTLASVPTPDPAADEVVVRVDAAPINPSDLALLFGTADMTTARASGTTESPVVTAQIPEKLRRFMAGRVDQSMPGGNEGAGTVVRAGSSSSAQALLGKVVGAIGGAMYSQYRCLKVDQCLELPTGTTAIEGASSFVNPLTALGIVETMRLEGHKAVVHTAAASNLGQMLCRVCREDGIGLVNVVRKDEQAALLRGLGAIHVYNGSSPSFLQDLTQALVATGATIAFDATGGGKLASQILTCMEAALNTTATTYSRYGSSVHKQVYIYGSLDPSPTELTRNFGLAWGIGGWLLTPFLAKIGGAATQKLKDRVAREIKTTFASSYAGEVSLAGALNLDAIAAYGKRATGEKYVIRPTERDTPLRERARG
jgi:NADPH2:quinone reductase